MEISWFIFAPFKWPWQKNYNYDQVMASTWIRCLQLIPFLSQMGISSRINSYSRKTAVAVFLRRWSDKDRKLAIKLRNRGVKIVADTPVNYFSNQSHNAFQGGVREAFLAFAEISNAIFCASRYTRDAGLALGYRTIALEDSINLAHFKYHQKPLENGRRPVFIWSGVSVKADALNRLAPLIKQKTLDVVVISDKRPMLDFDVRFIKWRYHSFPKDILQGDVGLLPRIVEDDYDKGHSFFKIGVFLAQQIPVICSPVPSYADVLTPHNSMVVEGLSMDKWEAALDDLIEGRKPIDFTNNPVNAYSTQQVAVKYSNVFENIIHDK